MSGAAGRARALRALAALDLTTLNDDDTAAKVEALCRKAVTPLGSVAAVCVWPRFAEVAAARVAGTPVKVACVANFPEGGTDAARAVADARQAIGAGAHEIDVVLPTRAFLAGDVGAAQRVLEATRAACGSNVALKVILESGMLCLPERIAAAARLALDCGADFIKTSTGKVAPGASIEAAEAMLCVLRAWRDEGRRAAGFKASGGVRTLAQAEAYLALADGIMGEGWATPATFRIGASGLLDALLRYLGAGGGAKTAGSY